jgi:hypothetical protein
MGGTASTPSLAETLKDAEEKTAHLKMLNSYMTQYKNAKNDPVARSKIRHQEAIPALTKYNERFGYGTTSKYSEEIAQKIKDDLQQSESKLKEAKQTFEKIQKESSNKAKADTNARINAMYPARAERRKLFEKAYYPDGTVKDALLAKEFEEYSKQINPSAIVPASAPPPFESMLSNPVPASAPPPSYNNVSIPSSAPPVNASNTSSNQRTTPPPSQDPSMPPVISITPSEKPKPTFYAPQGISATPIEVPVVENVLNKMDEEHPLWSFTNAFFTIIIMGIVVTATMYGMQALVDIDRIKADWPNQRCSPLIMPFAGFFGHSPKENFDFCMGKIFDGHSTPILGSIGAIFSQFTSLLKSIFNSVNSIRNIISSLGGGINVVFQEFTDRITNFFFELRMSAIRLKILFGRVYATLFSVMYMGLSGITGMSSFTNTFLFSFLDTFCFPGETEIMVLKDNRAVPTPIKEVKIGDVLLPGRTTVTATFRFYSRGQAMVQLGRTVVSTNHYVMYNGKPIMAGEHPHAIQLGPWNSDEHLYCVNTTDHTIPVGGLTFMDYDETPEGDAATLQWIEERINARSSQGKKYPYADACFAIQEDAKIKTESGLRAAKEIKIGDRLTTGCEVVGVIRRRVSEACVLSSGVKVTPATLYWKDTQWLRYGEHHVYEAIDAEFVSFVVTPHSQIELEDGTRVRDYMELCSPDAEMHYTALLESE